MQINNLVQTSESLPREHGKGHAEPLSHLADVLVQSANLVTVVLASHYDKDNYLRMVRPLLVVGMIGMIHPNGDEFHPKAPCHWDEIHPNGWRLLAPLG